MCESESVLWRDVQRYTGQDWLLEEIEYAVCMDYTAVYKYSGRVPWVLAIESLSSESEFRNASGYAGLVG
jgi:hypothetical protein